MSDTLEHEAGLGERAQFNRRKMVGWLMGGTALVASVEVVAPDPADAMLPTVNPTDAYDLSDLLRDVTRPTNLLITITVNKDGTVALDLPRSENGQGITTSMGMIVADELGVPADAVKVTLADAKPELAYNQFTGGSVATFELYQPLRAAAALARGAILEAAAEQLQIPQTQLSVLEGVVEGGNVGIPIGDLIDLIKVPNSKRARKEVKLKANAEQKIVGTERGRTDARDIVTGKKQFTMDLKVPNALPTMLCRAPTINGSAKRLRNMAEIKKMPGVTDVVVIPNTSAQRNGVIPGGVAVRAKTFGQCMAAIRAMKVDWADGTVKGKNADTVLKELRKSELPLTPALPGKVLEQEFIFHFRPGDPLETNTAVADVRADRAEIWSPLKSPIWAKERLANDLKLPLDKVTVHVTEGGGSFGRHLFSDGAFEAAAVSRAMGNKPVRLMWHRADGPRQGRCHPMAISRVRIVHDDKQVLALDQRHTSVATDFTQGLGEILTAAASTPPAQNFLQYSQTVFNLTAMVPYNYGAVTQLLNEIYEYNTFNTSSVRNIYSPNVRTACELLTDELAKRMGKDPFAFRQEFARHERMRNVLAVLKKEANWGRKMPAGTAQGIGIHREYKGFAGCVVEIDARPKTVNRKIKGAVTGPLVRKATFVVDVGLPINPLGLKAQMMGGIMDGIGQVLTYGLHLVDGSFLEASWDNAFYTRQWNSPRTINIVVMPKTAEEPGGAGELGVAAAMSATASALSRATGKMITEFPYNQGTLGFKPYPLEPPIPESPKNGLKYRNAPKQRH